MISAEYTCFVNGAMIPAHEAATWIQIHNPSSGAVITRVQDAGRAEVEAAVKAAKTAFDSGVWSGKSARERSRVLHKAADILRARASDFAIYDSKCTGRAIREMAAQTSRMPEWLEYFGSIIEGLEGQLTPFAGSYLNYVRRLPLGVVAQFTAFNHPLLLAIKKVAPALAAGNCIVLKPSEVAPVSAFELAKILTEAGLPNGVLNVVTGYGNSCGKALLEDFGSFFSKFDLTGGERTGRIIAQAAGRHLARCTTELGGTAPILVFNDAVIADAVNGVCFGAFIAAGQTCIAAKRILCQKDIAAQFLDLLTEKCALIAKGMGDPENPSTSMGCLISEDAAKRVEEAVNNAVADGAKVSIGGARDRAFYTPTILTNVTPQMACVQEEIFGPVITFQTFEDEKEAVVLANTSRFGLGAAVWSRDVKRAHRVAHSLRAGIVWVNDHHRNDPSSPWGGLTADSGTGRENGWECLREYTQTQSVVVSIEDAETPFDWFAGQEKRYN